MAEPEYRFVRMLPRTKERPTVEFRIQDPDTGAWRHFSRSDAEPWKRVTKGFAELLAVQTVHFYQPGSPKIFIVCDEEEKRRYDAQEKAEWLSRSKRDRPDLRTHDDWTRAQPQSPVERHGTPQAEASPPPTEADHLRELLRSQQEQIDRLEKLLSGGGATVTPSPSLVPDPFTNPPVSADARAEALGLTDEPPGIPPSDASQEDLTAIKGIGEKMAKRLWTEGIKSIRQLAVQDPVILAKRLEDIRAVSPRSVEQWINQAKLHAKR